MQFGQAGMIVAGLPVVEGGQPFLGAQRDRHPASAVEGAAVEERVAGLQQPAVPGVHRDRGMPPDIAEAAGVSPRTYNNYFSSREQAIVAAVTAEREARIAAAVTARPATVRLADAVVEAIVAQYTQPGEHGRDVLLLLTTNPPLRKAFADTARTMEDALTDAIAERLSSTDPDADSSADPDAAGDPVRDIARVLAASVAAAVRVALERWARPAPGPAGAAGLIVPSGSLPDLLRAALAPLAPALDAAEHARR